MRVEPWPFWVVELTIEKEWRSSVSEASGAGYFEESKRLGLGGNLWSEEAYY